MNNLKIRLGSMIVYILLTFVFTPCVAKAEKQGILRHISSDYLVFNISIDSLPKQVISSINTVNDSAKIVDTTIVNNAIKEDLNFKRNRKENLEVRIGRLEKRLSDILQKYELVHSILERYVRMEATERLLHIDHYNARATRIAKNKTGVKFVVQSILPDGLKPREVTQSIIKLTSSFSHALLRYSRISNLNLLETDAQIEIELYGNNLHGLIEPIKNALLEMPLKDEIRTISSDSPYIVFTLKSSNFFEKELQELENKEQKLDRDIRLLKLALEE